MKTTLHFPPGVYEDLLSHLLPPPPRVEEAVFVFVLTKPLPSETRLEFLAAEKLSAKDFAVQHELYLELTDEARRRLIKRAHDLKASIIDRKMAGGIFRFGPFWSQGNCAAHVVAAAQATLRSYCGSRRNIRCPRLDF